MIYYLRVYDNFHYMNELEAYDYGQFETYEEALVMAKSIVDEFLEQNWESGITQGKLLAKFSIYGEDPIILPNTPKEYKRFSARTYAKQSVSGICRKLKRKCIE